MSNTQYTTIDRILYTIGRDLRGTDIHETDVIDWAGEALEFLETPEIQEEAVAFLKVENFEADIPKGFKMVLQVAKYDKEEEDILENCKEEEVTEEEDYSPCDNPDETILDCSIAYLISGYRPYFDMQWQYIPWTVSETYMNNFSPVRLANHSLFNSIVCQEKGLDIPYGRDEYNIVGTIDKKLRFSFKEGFVALAYIKAAVDPETGYPLIPDVIQHITAINYYIKWKIAERMNWSGRRGFSGRANESMELWLKYAKQAKNYARMPKSIDEYQNMMEESHHMIPRNRRYYNYFGNLGRNRVKI